MGCTRPSKISDPEYQDEYDLCFGNIKVEVKTCRAINTKKRGDLVSKALRYESLELDELSTVKTRSLRRFYFHRCFVDRIIYWVLSLAEVKGNQYLSHQHRGGIEYQIGITKRNLHDFDVYKVDSSEIGEAIKKKAEKS